MSLKEKSPHSLLSNCFSNSCSIFNGSLLLARPSLPDGEQIEGGNPLGMDSRKIIGEMGTE